MLALRTSGAPNWEISSTWIVYDAAPATSLQSNVTGCADMAPSAGLTSAGAAGGGGGGGCVGAVPLTSTFATNASPQKIVVSPAEGPVEGARRSW